MEIFDVYEHPTKGLDAVKKGFCFPAAIFGWVWALVAKQWNLAAVLFALMLVINELTNATDFGYHVGVGVITNIATIIISVVVGFKANEWRASNLLKKSYALRKTLQASNREEAHFLATQNKD